MTTTIKGVGNQMLRCSHVCPVFCADFCCAASLPTPNQLTNSLPFCWAIDLINYLSLEIDPLNSTLSLAHSRWSASLFSNTTQTHRHTCIAHLYFYDAQQTQSIHLVDKFCSSLDSRRCILLVAPAFSYI